MGKHCFVYELFGDLLKSTPKCGQQRELASGEAGRDIHWGWFLRVTFLCLPFSASGDRHKLQEEQNEEPTSTNSLRYIWNIFGAKNPF